MGHPRSLLLVALATAPLDAQTFVVDITGAAGSHYAQIAAAVAAVPNGATLLVRPGIYQGFGIAGKGVTILGDPGATIDGLVDVANTSPSQATMLRGFDWVLYSGTATPTSTPTSLLTLTNCAGRVVLEDVDTSAGVNCVMFFGQCNWTQGLRASDCPQLVIRDCAIHAGATLTNCDVLIESSDFLGKDWQANSAGHSTWGLAMLGGSAQIAGTSRFVGGSGVGGMVNASASPGIRIWNGGLRFLAGQSTGGGMAGTAFFPPQPALEVANASVRIDPVVTLTAFGVPPVAGFVTWTTMPTTTSTGAPPGATLAATVRATNGDLVILLLGLPGPPISIAGFADPFWLDPAVFVFHAIGVQQNGVAIGSTLAVPTVAAFRGLSLVWQGVTSGPTTGFAATNPSFAIVR